MKMFDMLSIWQNQAETLNNGEITKEGKDNLRYNYLKFDALNFDKENVNERSSL